MTANELGQLGQSNRKIIDEKLRRYEKARAVLAEHQDLVLHATASPNDDPMRILIVALADALGGAGDE